MLLDILGGGNYSFPQIIAYILSCITVILLTMPIHEFAHAFTANKLGDPTARFQGRLSLNPFNHIDYVGAFCILIFGFGWAKPVPVNASYFKSPKRDMAITALAGPLSNLVLALIASLLNNTLILVFSRLSFEYTMLIYISMFLGFVATINISLAVFNLIPIPPLDGSRLLTAILPTRTYYKLMRYERYFFFILIALLWVGVLDIPLSFLTSKISGLIGFISSLPFRLFV